MVAARSRRNNPGRALEEVLLGGDPTGWIGLRPDTLELDALLPAWAAALRSRGRPGLPATVGVYAHFAYCKMSCRFCQYYHAVPRDDLALARYTDHLERLVGRFHGALGHTEVSSAYFGGGTPTALSADELERFLRAFSRTFRVRGEHTCEAHPAALDERKIDLLARFGVTRISMGIQTFDAGLLAHVGRTNEADERIRALVERARACGLLVNLDLILGLPDQTRPGFERDAARILELGPDTVTVYRYQPVERLPSLPSETLGLTRVFTRELVWRFLRAGYFTTGARTDAAYGVGLVKVSPQWLRPAWRMVRRVVARAAGADPGHPWYGLGEEPFAHVLGLGSGAISHLFGHAWYRDVTHLDHATGGRDPVYWGSRLGLVDECRTAAMGMLARGDWVRPERLAAVFGVDGPPALDEALAEGARSGTLEGRAGRVRIAPGAAPSARSTTLRALLPRPRSDAAREAAERSAAAADREDVQPDLIEVDALVRRAVSATDPQVAVAQPGSRGRP